MANSRPLMESLTDYERRVNDRLEEFVNYFVKEFEAKLLVYRLVLEGEVKKPGKLAETVAEKIGEGGGAITGTLLGSLVQMPAQGAKLGSVAGKTLGKAIGDTIGSQHQQSKVAAMLAVIENWCKDKASFREKLVEAGFDIFQSFEMQFMRVASDVGPIEAMKLLATDAANRAFSFLRKDNNALISKSVILGKSKKMAYIYPGFEIKYRYLNTKTWRTAHLYGMTGVVRKISFSPSGYYKKKQKGESNTAEYGYRRLLACEDWEVETGNYVSDNIAKNNSGEFADYSYILTSKVSEEKTQTLLNNFNAKDESLREERIREVIMETKTDILEEIRNFKDQFECFRDNNDVALKSLEDSLNNLNMEEYFKQFSQCFKDANQEIFLGIKDTHKKLNVVTQISESSHRLLEEIHRTLVPQKLQEENNALDITRYTYIPRTINRHEHIKSGCLKAEIDDIFAINNIDVNELSKLVREGQNVCQFTEEDANTDTLTRFVILDKHKPEENFEKLCEMRSKCSIHWIEKIEDGKLLWKRSHGSISNLRDFVDKENITEYQPKKVEDIHGKIVVVCGGPGIGKSTLLNHLKGRQSDKGNLLRVIGINLIDYRDELSKARFSKLYQVYEFLQKIVPGLILEESAILFDGFDEICPRYEQKVIRLLKFLKSETEVKKIYVTSRPNMRDVLENELCVFSHNLAPFSKDHQISFLCEFWQTNLVNSIKLEKTKELCVKIRDSNNDEEVENLCQEISNVIEKENKDDSLRAIQALILSIRKNATFKSRIISEILGIVAEVHTASTLVKDMSSNTSGNLEEIKLSIQVRAERFAVKLLGKFPQRVGDKEMEFAGIPLQTRMLAEAFEDDFHMFYTSTEDDVTLPDNFNLIDLYKRFVKCKYEIYYKEKIKSDLKSPIVLEALESDLEDTDNYAKLAVSTLFSMDETNSFDLHVGTKKRKKLERVGIVTHRGNNIDFTHRTFAEYFAAVFFINSILRKPKSNVILEFVRRQILKDRFKIIRDFFDRLLIQACPLHIAVLNVKTEKIRLLVNEDGNCINSTDTAGRTALHLASGYGYSDIVEILLDHNADINIKDNLFDWRPLRYAEKGHHLEVAEQLLQRNANVEDMIEAVKDIKNFNSYKKVETALHLAAKKGLVKSIQIFIQVSKAHRKTISDTHSRSLEIVKLLQERNLSIEDIDAIETAQSFIDDNDKQNLVPGLAIKDLFGSAEHLLRVIKPYESDILDAHDKCEFTPLHQAAKNNHLEIVRILVKENVDINAQTKQRFTPLHFAAKGGFLDIVNLLLDNRAKVEDFEIPYKITPLHLAAENGHQEVIEILCKKGKASVDATTPKRTPLMIAAQEGKLQAVKALLQCGADAELTIENQAALDYAVMGRSSQVIRLLLCKKANIDVDYSAEIALKMYGTNAVILACRYNQPKVLEFILGDKNFDIEPHDRDGENHNAFYYALRSNNVELLRTLVDQWPYSYFDFLLSNHYLQNLRLLSKTYKELKLEKVDLSEEMQISVEEILQRRNGQQ